MALTTAAHTAGAVEGAVDARLDAVALWALQGPGPLDVRTGVVYAPGNPMQVLGTSATSPWAVTVNPGHTVAKKSGVSNGVYYNCNGALTTVALAVPPASNSRIDTIYAMQLDLAAIVDADGSTAAVIGAVTGTGGNGGLGATPTVPAVPVGATALYSVQILSTATAGTSGAGVTITRLFQWTVPRGVPIPVLSAAERDAITLRDDLRVYRLDLHCLHWYDGTTWHSGAVPLTYNDAGLVTSGTINVFTTALRTVTDPFGPSMGYRCKVTYFLGSVTAAAGVNARANINVNSGGARYGLISPLSSAAPSVVTDMPAGGTVTFQGVLTNLSATMATSNDPTVHNMTTEVTPI